MRLGRLRQVHAWVGRVPRVRDGKGRGGFAGWVCGFAGLRVCGFAGLRVSLRLRLRLRFRVSVKKCKYLSRSTLSFLLSQDSRFFLLSTGSYRFLALDPGDQPLRTQKKLRLAAEQPSLSLSPPLRGGKKLDGGKTHLPTQYR
jgi:hypothetical protein